MNPLLLTMWPGVLYKETDAATDANNDNGAAQLY